MPKGGDIHNHIDGAIYAADLIHFGANEGFCIDPTTFAAYKNTNCDSKYRLKNIPDQPTLYRNVIDAWSMRYFPINMKTGLPQFFNAFPEMENLLLQNIPQAIVSIVNRAGRQNEEYLELMIGSSELNIRDDKGRLPIQVGDATPIQKNLNVWHEALLKNGLNKIIEKTKARMLSLNKEVNNLMMCGTDKAEPGCSVTVRYQYYTRRILPPNEYYAQLVTAFAVANSSPILRAINIVMPENWTQSLRYYTEQMRMIGFLKTIYPDAHVTLHAGELTLGQVPPKYLTSHVDEAVNIARAERIGHAVDLPYEKNSAKLMKEMAEKHIDIEVNLTSNKDVLSVSGKQHPLPMFLEDHIPVTLSTDDEGIERTDLTQQYKIAELDYGLSYKTLKDIARNNLTYGFVEGKPLWKDFDYQRVVSQCANQLLGSDNPSSGCQVYLNKNLKAKLQWYLEQEFHLFEARIAQERMALS